MNGDDRKPGFLHRIREGNAPKNTTARTGEMRQRRTVLLLLDRRGSNLIKRRLLRANYVVLETYTTDHAVAVCVNQPVDAAILDVSLFVETGGWSVAQSLKAVKPNLCVLLISNARKLTKKLPKGIDAMINGDETDDVMAELERMIEG